MIHVKCEDIVKKQFKLSSIFSNVRHHLIENLKVVTENLYDDPDVDQTRNTASKQVQIKNYRFEFNINEESYLHQSYTRKQEWRLYLTLYAFKTSILDWDTFLAMVGVNQVYSNSIEIYNYYILDFSMEDNFDKDRNNQITCNMLVTPKI